MRAVYTHTQPTSGRRAVAACVTSVAPTHIKPMRIERSACKTSSTHTHHRRRRPNNTIPPRSRRRSETSRASVVRSLIPPTHSPSVSQVCSVFVKFQHRRQNFVEKVTYTLHGSEYANEEHGDEFSKHSCSLQLNS